jgi:hypothetical protein
MRTALPIILVALAGPAAAQFAPDPAAIAQRNQIAAEQEAQRQQALALERQSFAAEQRAQTNRALSDLATARAGQPPAIAPVTPPASSAWAARADALRRLADEAQARDTRLFRPGNNPRP